MAAKRHKEGKRGRKVGRNQVSCARYKTVHRREKNKIKKVNRHLRRHPADALAVSVVERLKLKF